jgi:hypothetical protein
VQQVFPPQKEKPKKVKRSEKTNYGRHPSIRFENMMAAKISDLIDLLSSDDDRVVSFLPEKVGSNPRQKKRPPFLPLNGRDLRKLRSNDNNMGEDPRSRMQHLFHREGRKTMFLFSSYKTQTISFLGSPPCHSYTLKW